MYDDRLSKKFPRTEMISFTCRNHPNLRWYGKNIQSRSIFFRGEVLDEPVTVTSKRYNLETGESVDVTEEITFKQSADLPDPIKMLKARLAGVNVYDQTLSDPDGPMTEWEEILKFVKWIEYNRERFAFECSCPARDLIVIEDPDSPDVED